MCRLYVGDMLRRSQIIDCQAFTLSEIISDHGLATIDLLKIDVERAELDVLAGIDDSDWPKIMQTVIEVHDLDGRLRTVQNLLQTAGFEAVETEQSAELQGSSLHTLYARRKVASGGELVG